MCTVQRPSLPRPTWLRLPLFALHVLSCYQVEHLIGGIIELGFVLPAMPGVSDPSRLYLSLCWSCCFDPLFRFPQHSTSPHVLWSRLTSPAVVTSISLSLLSELDRVFHTHHAHFVKCSMPYIYCSPFCLSLSPFNYLVPQTNFSLIFFLFSFFPFLCCADEKSSQAGSRQRREVSLCLSLFLSLSPYSFA
jgi:hypothetical protein